MESGQGDATASEGRGGGRGGGSTVVGGGGGYVWGGVASGGRRTWQSESQPSAPMVLLSSHASADERMPLPHTCTTGVTATASETVELAVTSSACVTFPTSRVLEPSATESTTSASNPSRRRLAPPTLTVDAFTVTKGCAPMCAGSPSE